MNWLWWALALLSGAAMYACGEWYNKDLKYAMGLPIALFGYFINPWAVWCAVTYLVATEIGYGQNSPLRKWLGDKAAVTIAGTALGLASFPLIGWWAILQGTISGVTFFLLDEFGANEPACAIVRSILSLIMV